MIIVLTILAALFLVFSIFFLIKNKQLKSEIVVVQKEAQASIAEAQQESESKRLHYESETQRVYGEAQAAVADAQKQLDQQFAEVKAQLEQEVEKLRQEREDAVQKKLQISQQTKEGHVYIISNIGSFGEGVYKIGQTLREPDVRIDELGGASVPFEFDIHALIKTKSARALEHKLHKLFLPMQVNKINSRKEFFRVSLTDIHQEVEKLNQGEDFTVKVWTDKAVATEYKESLDIEKNPEKKAKWLIRQKAVTDRQLKMDALRFSVADTPETDEDVEQS